MSKTTAITNAITNDFLKIVDQVGAKVIYNGLVENREKLLNENAELFETVDDMNEKIEYLMPILKIKNETNAKSKKITSATTDELQSGAYYKKDGVWLDKLLYFFNRSTAQMGLKRRDLIILIANKEKIDKGTDAYNNVEGNVSSALNIGLGKGLLQKIPDPNKQGNYYKLITAGQ